MMRIRFWCEHYPFLASATTVAVLGIFVALVWPREAITQANFAKMAIGMSQAQLGSLLGPPDVEVVQLGKVASSGTYVTNSYYSPEQLRQDGYRDYKFQQFTSSEITIIAITDMQGFVVCRYSGDGQSDIEPHGFWSRHFHCNHHY